MAILEAFCGWDGVVFLVEGFAWNDGAFGPFGKDNREGLGGHCGVVVKMGVDGRNQGQD